MTTPDLTDLATRIAQMAAEVDLLRRSSGSSLPRSPEAEQGQGDVNAPTPINPPRPSVLIKPPEMRELLDADQRTLRRWIRAGLIPEPARIGSSLRWRRSEVEAWIAAGMKPVKDPLTGKRIRRAAK